VARAKKDGVGALGQFVSYDAMVMHGPGTDPLSFDGIRDRARGNLDLDPPLNWQVYGDSYEIG
jgi:chitosanase